MTIIALDPDNDPVAQKVTRLFMAYFYATQAADVTVGVATGAASLLLGNVMASLSEEEFVAVMTSFQQATAANRKIAKASFAPPARAN